MQCVSVTMECISIYSQHYVILCQEKSSAHNGCSKFFCWINKYESE